MELLRLPVQNSFSNNNSKDKMIKTNNNNYNYYNNQDKNKNKNYNDKVNNNNNNNTKRIKYEANEQKAIIEIYDSFPDKSDAMKLIKCIKGFHNIYERKIKRWKSSDKMMGKPISQEFEDEVYEEYQKINDNLDKTFNIVSYVLIRQSGINIFNRDYLEENVDDNNDEVKYIKKWQYHPKTKSLQFTNKWVAGFVRRRRMKLQASLLQTTNSNFSFHPLLTPTITPIQFVEGAFILRLSSSSNDSTEEVTTTNEYVLNNNFQHHQQYPSPLNQNLLLSSTSLSLINRRINSLYLTNVNANIDDDEVRSTTLLTYSHDSSISDDTYVDSYTKVNCDDSSNLLYPINHTFTQSYDNNDRLDGNYDYDDRLYLDALLDDDDDDDNGKDDDDKDDDDDNDDGKDDDDKDDDRDK
jgi:hypothetical protein